MTRPQGGFIGATVTPTTAAAGGIWTLREAERFQGGGTWPRPFVPTDLTGLQLWLDASAADTLYDATSGGSLVAADGAVARWEDKSGNGRHATQGTSGDRPLRKTAIKNGKDVLRFDGSSDFMSIASSTATFNFAHDGTATVFVVYHWTAPGSAPSRRQILSNCSNSESIESTTGFFVWLRNDFGASSPYAKAQFVIANNGATRANSYTDDNSYESATFHVLTIESDPANATNADRVVFRKNGTVQSDTAAGDNAAVPTGNATYDLHICTQGGPNGRYYAEADMCEILLYDSTLSPSDRTKVEKYLLDKWGV